MTRRPNVLFVQADCGGGVPPAIAVARRLRERGHAVRFLAARSLERQLTRARCELAPVSRIYDQWFRVQRLLILSSPTFDFPADHLPEKRAY